ncbi:CheY-like chemotaxis protein [Deinococcus metalli]|uniref:CheY-like chemotaxis protein n=1 Tax=Deinococcus metalli TaxID=1141878 RepID=A0A7W8NNU7_9DEIO|nr:response regulator [Deinococcus metalli]MBB5377299.1 CheY-like chemotaxis protein [Deinococcus metalli]GHF47533.1 response regulator [Deinococcus metalli]
MTAFQSPHAPLHILLVEDNPDDAYLTREAFESLEPTPTFSVCSDGVDAMDYLHRQLSDQQALPDIVLMDLNMPRMDGFGLLEHLKRDPALRALPVLVFSTSNAREDVRRAYEAYANSYICKPRLFSEYEDVVQAVRTFWLRTASLPS